jgi:hypothetical protein
MLVRIGLPALAVMAAAWTLVQPDTPRPADTAAAVQQAAAEIEKPRLPPSSFWARPGPSTRPRRSCGPCPPPSMPRSSPPCGGPATGSPLPRAASDGIAALRRPVPRPARPERVARAECRSTTAPRGAPAVFRPVHRRLRTGRRAPFGPAAGHRPARTGRLRRAALGRPPAGQRPRDRGGPACRGAGHPDLALRAFAEGVGFPWGIREYAIKLGSGPEVRVSAVSPRGARMYA